MSLYRGKCIGRLIGFLREYCGLMISDHVIFHEDNKIMWHGKFFASYEWEGETDFPIFKFSEEMVHFNSVQERLKENMRKRDELLKKG